MNTREEIFCSVEVMKCRVELGWSCQSPFLQVSVERNREEQDYYTSSSVHSDICNRFLTRLGSKKTSSNLNQNSECWKIICPRQQGSERRLNHLCLYKGHQQLAQSLCWYLKNSTLAYTSDTYQDSVTVPEETDTGTSLKEVAFQKAKSLHKHHETSIHRLSRAAFTKKRPSARISSILH